MVWVVDWLRDLLSSFLSGLGLLNKEATIILIGLDNAGKSTLLHRLSKGAFGSFAPTEKPTNDEFTAAGVTFKAWDLGGHEAVRALTNHRRESMGYTTGTKCTQRSLKHGRALYATPHRCGKSGTTSCRRATA